MEFERKFAKRKKSNPKRGIFLIILLIIVLILWFQADNIIARIFE